MLLISFFAIWSFSHFLAKIEAFSISHQPGWVELSLSYHDALYYVPGVRLGTPGQNIDIQIDTGSSDLVVVQSGYFPNSSTTGVDTGQVYPMAYKSINKFTMTKFLDTISWATGQLANFTFGWTKLPSLNDAQGILGVGYTDRTALGTYLNFPAKLKNDGLIGTTMYSFNGRPKSPSVLFGAVDKSQYSGPLMKNTILRDVGPTAIRATYTSLAITVHSVEVNGIVVSDQKLAYEIDSGANVLATTETVAQNILTVLGPPDYSTSEDDYWDEQKMATLVSVNFSGFVAQFPLADIVGDTQTVAGSSYCSINLAVVGIGINSYIGTMPNAILKHYYTVYDLDNNNVFLAPLAPLAHGSGPASIVPVSGTYNVPTTTGSQFSDAYTKMYDESLETVVTASAAASTSSKGPEHSNSPSRNNTVSLSGSTISPGACLLI